MAPTCTCRPVRIHIPTAMRSRPPHFGASFSMDIAARKQAMREQQLARRAGFVAGSRPARIGSRRIFPLGSYSRTRHRLGHIAIGEEADPVPLIEALRARGYAIALPRVAGKAKPLAFHLYEEGAKLVQASLAFSAGRPTGGGDSRHSRRSAACLRSDGNRWVWRRFL